MAGLKKRGETWYARHVYYENGKRKEKLRSLDTKDETVARRRLRAVAAEIDSGKWGEASKMRFAELVRRFRIERRATIKPNTLKRYDVSLRQIMPVFQDKCIGEITRSDISNFVAGRRHAPGRNGRGKVTDAAIRTDLACISAVLGFGIEKEIIEANVVTAYLKGAGKRSVKRAQARTRYLSHDEEAALLRSVAMGSASSMAYREKLSDAIIFAIETGMRQREQFKLPLPNVHLGARPYVVATDTKSGKDRKIYLSERAHEVVQRQVATRYLFETRGKPMTDMDKGFKSALRRAGIEGVQWHDLRRTCGCRLLQDKRATMVQVRDILGHASITTTEKHYAFLALDDLHEVMTRPIERRAVIGGGRILNLAARQEG